MSKKNAENKSMKNRIFLFLLTVFFIFSPLSIHGEQVLNSTSSMDWTNYSFNSSVTLNLEKAGINMPSGKMSAINKINMELPDLIKDPLLTLTVDSNTQLGDLVLNDSITLEQISAITNQSKKTPAIFVSSGNTLKTSHFLDTLKLSSILIKHNYPYKNARPVENIPSRKYTGIIIDARGKLNVHGEFTQDEVFPCFFPVIWDEKMNCIYERNMGDPESEGRNGMVHYDWSSDISRYTDRIGNDPLHISARKVYGRFRTDPVSSRKDALKILSVPENLELLRQGKVVILLDKENLVYDVSVPEKTKEYYTDIKDLKTYFFENNEEAVIQDTVRGIQILYDLKFEADSPKLLESEQEKVKNLAENLKKINADNAYTILIEGHTADINKPEGQMKLSIERTQTIIEELVKNGLERSIFTYRGYGGTQPVADNSTEEGRAQNRRVIITARPKATYIQRK